MFGDLYPWAGELRTVSIAEGDPFCLPRHIESFADDTFTRLAAADYLRSLDRAEFIDGLTELLGDLNALHPFRDGNGRTRCSAGRRGARISRASATASSAVSGSARSATRSSPAAARERRTAAVTSSNVRACTRGVQAAVMTAPCSSAPGLAT